jgi:hypothetical protein
VPKALPALAQAQSVHSRASKADLAPEVIDEGAMLAEVGRLADAAHPPSGERLGDLLMGIAALAAARGLDAEDALRLAIGRYREQVAAKERYR